MSVQPCMTQAEYTITAAGLRNRSVNIKLSRVCEVLIIQLVKTGERKAKLIFWLFFYFVCVSGCWFASGLSWVVGDAMELPFDDDQFDIYTIAFGIRNVTRIDQVRSAKIRRFPNDLSNRQDHTFATGLCIVTPSVSILCIPGCCY